MSAATPVKRLSGGQQQRLSLALALVGRPELVFLDEPTAGMDPQARRVTWELIRQLRADGVSVVLTTHFLDEAEQLADTVIVMDSGRIVAQGTPAELTRAGAEGQIRFRATPGLRLDSLVTALPAGTTATEPDAGHYLVSGDVNPQLLATLTAWCATQGVLAEHLAVERRSLEDVFLDVTGRELSVSDACERTNAPQVRPRARARAAARGAGCSARRRRWSSGCSCATSSRSG